jgi:hypothetical protein
MTFLDLSLGGPVVRAAETVTGVLEGRWGAKYGIESDPEATARVPVPSVD